MVKESRGKQQENVLVEEVRQKLRVVAEGHTSLHRKIDGIAEELKGDIRQVDRKVDRAVRDLGAQIRGLSNQMDTGFGEVVKLVTSFETQLKEHVHSN